MVLSEQVTQASNSVLAGSVSFMTFLAHAYGYLPGAVAIVSGLMSILWCCFAIWEGKTMKSWRKHRAERKVAQLKAKLAHYEREAN